MVAADVNANFNAVETEVDDNNNRISALENTKTAYLNIPAAAFVPTESSTDYNNEGGWYGARIMTNTGTGNYVAAVYLPHGATITAFTYSYSVF